MMFREHAGTAASAVTWMGGTSLALLALLHALAGDLWLPIVWLHAIAPFVLPWALPFLLIAAARRKPDQAVPPALALIVWAWGARPPFGADRTDGGRPLRVATSNALMVNADPRPLGRELLGLDADVLVVQELTPDTVDALSSGTWVTKLERPAWHSYGLGLYAKHPLVSHQWVELAGVDWLRAVLDVRGTEVEVWNVHTLAPYSRANHRGWLVQVEAFAHAAAQVERPLLLLGDLNLTPGHEAYRTLMGPFDDAHTRCGRWGAWTWPANGVHLDWMPRIRLDHVLLAGPWRCASIAEGVGAGSDHRPIVADLLLDP